MLSSWFLRYDPSSPLYSFFFFLEGEGEGGGEVRTHTRTHVGVGGGLGVVRRRMLATLMGVVREGVGEVSEPGGSKGDTEGTCIALPNHCVALCGKGTADTRILGGGGGGILSGGNQNTCGW